MAAAFSLRQAGRLAALLCAVCAQPAHAFLSDSEARRGLAELKAATEQKSDIQQKALLDLAGQIQSLRDEIARMRGQLETQSYELEQAQKRQQDFYVDLDNRLRKLEAAAVAPQPAAAAADPAQAEKAYEAALNLFKAKQFKEAAEAFTAFRASFPQSPLAANAQFWLGNAWLAQGNCKQASEAHTQLFSQWPDSPRAADAMLAVASCQQELGQAPAARKTLETLLARYPDAPAAASAKQKLKKK